MSDQNEHGSFLTGFTIGLFAGAASLFLFGTKRGAKVRTRLAQEWDEAKHYLESEGVIEQGKTSIRDVFQSIVDNFQDHQEPTKSKPSTVKTKSAVKKISADTPKTAVKPATKKFKGT